MIGNDVFVAFPNKNTALAVAKTAMSAGFNVACAVLSANALRQKMGYYDGGIVICEEHGNGQNDDRDRKKNT